MSRRYWLSAIALGFLIATGSGFAQDQQVNDQTKTYTPDQPAKYSKPPLAVTVIGPVNIEPGKTIEPNWGEPNCKSVQNHDEADLCQQLRMAKAAEDTYYWTKWAAIVGSIGTAFLIWNLIEARRSGSAAVVSAKAAVAAATETKRQADLSEQSFARLERPYVYIFGVHQIEVDRGSHFGSQPQVKYTVANFGKTPAQIRILAAGISAFKEPLDPLIQDYRDDRAHDLLNRPILAPGDVRKDISLPAPDSIHFVIPDRPGVLQMKVGDVAPILNDPQDQLFVWIRIQYRGPFGPGYMTNACWRYDGLTNRFVKWGEEEEYNGML